MEISEEFLVIRRRQLQEIKQIEEDKKSLTRGQMETKYTWFADKYPKTWVNIMDNTFLISHFERNLEVYEKLYTRSVGDHFEKRFNADIGMGEILAEKYLYPTFGKPSKESMQVVHDIAKKKALSGEEEVEFDKSKMTKIDLLK